MNIRRILRNTTWFVGAFLFIALVAVAMGMQSAHATNPPTSSTPNQTQSQTQTARAEQTQSTTSTANNSGNEQATTITTQHVKQVPAIAQGTVFVAGCGVGGNAGGSRSSGAGFLGISFTPDECYRYFLSQSFAALGMTDAACEVLLSTRTAKRVFRDKPMPSCSREPVTTNITVESSSDTKPPQVTPPTREEVQQAIDRAFKKSQGK